MRMAATPTTISNQIFGKCTPALGIDSSRCDGITALTIEATTANDLQAIYNGGTALNPEWRIMDILLEADFVGKACFPRINGLYDWITAMARTDSRRLTLSQIQNGLWELYPFIKMERRSPINNEYWTGTAGAAGGTAPNGQTADWKMNVTSQGGLPVDPRWFPPKMRVFVSSLGTGSVHGATQYMVVDSAVTGGVLTIYLKAQNSASFLPSAKTQNPTTGLIMRGTPNVSDYESYCPQVPGLNTRQLTPFWLETTRWSFVMCELMERYLQAIRDNNKYFKMFGDVEDVELNRQIQEDFQRRFAWSFFFNKPLPGQTLNTYDTLEQIKVADGTIHNPNAGATVARRAAAIGIYEQHAECGRVKDLLGQVLNLQELFNELYNVQRVRKANGLDGKMIEVYTDSLYAIQLQQGLLNYFNSHANGLFRYNLDMCSKCADGPFGFKFREFQLDRPDVILRIVTNDFFDDLVAAHRSVNANLETPGRNLWIIDWSVNYVMNLASSSVTLASGDLERLAAVDYAAYGCIMKLPKNRQKMYSKTYSFVTECPQSSLFIENIGFGVPEYRGVSAGDTTDLYGVYSG